MREGKTYDSITMYSIHVILLESVLGENSLPIGVTAYHDRNLLGEFYLLASRWIKINHDLKINTNEKLKIVLETEL